MTFTLSDIKNSACGARNPHLEGATGKKSKYGNTIVEFDGKIFRSKKELGRYVELRMLQTAGEIFNLQCQVPFELNEGGTHSVKYVADFLYRQGGQIIIEDTKGFRTKKYLRSKALMLKIHGIEIKET